MISENKGRFARKIRERSHDETGWRGDIPTTGITDNFGTRPM
jgi:hypothetical protein